MSTITALEAKTRFGKLLARVAKGEEVIITKHDKPVARILPPKVTGVSDDLSRFAVAAEEFRKIRERIRTRTKGKQVLTDEEVRSAIAEGRR
jgi:prevent-host-death family protein